jgi:DNA repair exonuclease SbcCD ATPase subunit
MPAKKTACFFIALLLLSGLMCTVEASSDKALTFSGAGVTIDLTYPEEAHPNITITHDVTITANANLTLINIGIFVYAPVNSTLQLIKSQPLSWGKLDENDSLPTSQISIRLPEQTDGKLYCNMTVQTEIDSTINHAYYSFYTTRISELTFSEMQSLYDEMLANYTALQEVYSTLLNEYNGLLVNYTNLFHNYTVIVGQYDTLSEHYNDEVGENQKLLDDFNDKSDDYIALYNNYEVKITELDDLNSTLYSLQGNYTTLKADYDALNQTYTEMQKELASMQKTINTSQNALDSDKIVMFIFIVAVACLVAFIVYTKRKKQEPYVVIRKETVSVNHDENSEAS